VNHNPIGVYADYATKTSDNKETYSTGMVRDSQVGKPRFDLIEPENIPFANQMLTRWAQLMSRGATNYGERNWEKARTKEERDRARASFKRHSQQWYHGEKDEDHAAAIFFNVTEVELIDYFNSVEGGKS
jgi:hypothetical protein